MKRNPAFALLCLLGMALPALADTFLLKDGTSVEGTVVSDTGDTYVLDVQVTKTIRDERRIPKADVVKVTREELDAKAFEAISKLVPSPDLLTADEYALNIAAIEKFIKAYPTSDHLKDARKMLATLKEEASQVAGGGMKINGKVVSAAEYQANAYDLDAHVQESRIRDLVNDNQILPALRLFVDFDHDYRNTLAYGSLITLMKQAIKHQVEQAKESLSTLESRNKERAIGVQRMDLQDRRKTEEAILSEAAQIEARYKAEKDSKQNWPTTTPYHKASLEDTVKFGQAELVRLSAVKTILGLDSGRAYREVYNALQSGANAVTVTTAIANAKAAGVPPRYLEPLETRAKGVTK